MRIQLPLAIVLLGSRLLGQTPQVGTSTQSKAAELLAPFSGIEARYSGGTHEGAAKISLSATFSSGNHVDCKIDYGSGALDALHWRWEGSMPAVLAEKLHGFVSEREQSPSERARLLDRQLEERGGAGAQSRLIYRNGRASRMEPAPRDTILSLLRSIIAVVDELGAGVTDEKTLARISENPRDISNHTRSATRARPRRAERLEEERAYERKRLEEAAKAQQRPRNERQQPW